MKLKSKKILSFVTAFLLASSYIPESVHFAEEIDTDNSTVSIQDAGYVFSFDEKQVSYSTLKTVKDYQGEYEGLVLEGGSYILDASKADRKVAEVNINIEKNSGINTGVLRFDYDNSDGLEFLGILYTDKDTKKITSTDAQLKLAKPSLKRLLISNSSKDSVDTGIMATLLFIVPEKFDEGKKYSLDILDTSNMYAKNDTTLSTYGKSGYIELYANEIPALPEETTAVTTTTPEETTAVTTTTPEETTVVTTTTPEETTVVTTTPEETTVVTTTTPEETTVVTTTTPEETTVVTTTTPEETTVVTTTTPEETTVVTTTTPEETTVVTTTTPVETTTEEVSETEVTEQKQLKIIPEDISYDMAEGKSELLVGIYLKDNDGISGLSADVKIDGPEGNFKQKILNGDFEGTLDTNKDGTRFMFTSPDGKNIDAVDARIALLEVTLPEDISQGEYKVVLSNVTVSKYNAQTGKNENFDVDIIDSEAGSIKITGEKAKITTTPEVKETTSETTTSVSNETTAVTTTPSTTVTTKKQEETEATTSFDVNKYFEDHSAVKFSLEDIKMKEGNIGLEAVIRIDGDLPISGFQCDIKLSDENVMIKSLHCEAVDFNGDLNTNKNNNKIQFTAKKAHNIEASSGKIVKLEYTFENMLENGNYNIELSNISASTYIEGINQRVVPADKIIADNESGNFEVTTYVPDIKIVQMPEKRYYYSFDSNFDISGIKITANDKDISEYVSVNAVPSEIYNADTKKVLYEIPIMFKDKEIASLPVYIGVKGDVNSDGTANPSDATLILKQTNEIAMKWIQDTGEDTEFDKLYASALENSLIPETVDKEEFTNYLNFIADTYSEDTLNINAMDATMILRFFNQLAANSIDGIEKDHKTVWEELSSNK